MSYSPKFSSPIFSSPIFTGTPKMYLAYALTVSLFTKFFPANSFNLHGSPKFSLAKYFLCTLIEAASHAHSLQFGSMHQFHVLVYLQVGTTPTLAIKIWAAVNDHIFQYDGPGDERSSNISTTPTIFKLTSDWWKSFR